jgi:glucose dehydrogenase
MLAPALDYGARMSAWGSSHRPMTYSVGGKQYVAVLAGYGGSAAMLE